MLGVGLQARVGGNRVVVAVDPAEVVFAELVGAAGCEVAVSLGDEVGPGTDSGGEVAGVDVVEEVLEGGLE